MVAVACLDGFCGKPTLKVGTVAREYAGGVDPATVHRWFTHGVPGPAGGRVVLRSVKVGGVRKTSPEAVAAFFAALNPPAAQ